MQTKLHDWHVRAGARMIDFSGWDMPIQYGTGPGKSTCACDPPRDSST